MGVLLLICLVVAGIGLLMVKGSEASIKHQTQVIRESTAPAVESISAELEAMGFTTTREIAVDYLSEVRAAPVKQVKVDSRSKRVAICDYEASKCLCLDFEEIVDCALVEDHNVIYESSVGRAVVGKVVAGDVGAIVGSTSAKSKDMVNSISVRVTTSDVDHSQIILETLRYRIQKNDDLYRSTLNHARELYSIFHSIVLTNDK